jgi:hypothetical protein
MTKKQVEKMFGFYKSAKNESFTRQVEALKEMRGKSETELRGQWGAAYEKKQELAQKAYDTFFKNKGLRKEFELLANDKGFIQALSEIAEKTGEDAIGGRGRSTLTPQEASSELNAILGKNHPMSKAFFNELDPEHDAAVDKVHALQSMALSGQ